MPILREVFVGILATEQAYDSDLSDQWSYTELHQLRIRPVNPTNLPFHTENDKGENLFTRWENANSIFKYHLILLQLDKQSFFKGTFINEHKSPSYIHTMTKYMGIFKVNLRGKQPSQWVLDLRNF